MSAHSITEFLEESGCAGWRWILTGVAGAAHHDLEGMRFRPDCRKLLPRPGERLTLTRRPFNPYDPNAIEVHWRRGRYMLGHIGRHRAVELAPVMDGGGRLDAFAWMDELAGDDPELKILLAGDIPETLHAEYHRRRASWIAYESDRALCSMDPEHIRLRALWMAFLDEERARLARRQQVVGVLAQIVMAPGDPKPLPPAPEGAIHREYLGREKRPNGLLTVEEWERLGYGLDQGKRGKPASRLVTMSGRTPRRQALWSSRQVVPLRDIPERGAAEYLRSSQRIRDVNFGIAPAVTLALHGRERCANHDERDETEHMFQLRYGLTRHQLALAVG